MVWQLWCGLPYGSSRWDYCHAYHAMATMLWATWGIISDIYWIVNNTPPKDSIIVVARRVHLVLLLVPITDSPPLRGFSVCFVGWADYCNQGGENNTSYSNALG